MEKSRISRLVSLIEQACSDLEVQPNASWVEGVALSVYTAMDQSTRVFHQLEHAFDVAKGQTGVGIFAALYHDIIYYQVDGRIPEPFVEAVSKYVTIGPKFSAIRDEKYMTPLTSAIVKIFGLSHGQTITSGPGFNEFLSALCAADQLSSILSPENILEIAAYIEATIPFRVSKPGEKSCCEVLGDRVIESIEELGINISEGGAHAIVQGAVIFANGDVDGFSSIDTGGFLTETWKLYNEINPSLRQANSFFCRSFRESLANGLKFFQGLEPKRVFHSYLGVPHEAGIEEKVQQVEKNLTIAISYIKVKLVTIGLVEAIAELTGGDAPISFFLGENTAYPHKEKIEFYLDPPLEIDDSKIHSNLVYELLVKGAEKNGFQIAPSPLSTYIHDFLGEDQTVELCTHAQQYFEEQMTAMEFLSVVDKSLIRSLLMSCSEICSIRKERMHNLLERLTTAKAS